MIQGVGVGGFNVKVVSVLVVVDFVLGRIVLWWE